MMRIFCDICGTEITKHIPLEGRRGRLCFRITTGMQEGGTRSWNAGHFCPDCIVRAITQPEEPLQKESLGR